MDKHWWVETPEWESIEPILDDGSGPSEWGRDVTCVRARSKREAILLGVKKMRDPDYSLKEFGYRYKTYYSWAWDRNTNPYTGVKANNAECEHGFCGCDLKDCERKDGEDYCFKCEEEWNKLYGS